METYPRQAGSKAESTVGFGGLGDNARAHSTAKRSPIATSQIAAATRRAMPTHVLDASDPTVDRRTSPTSDDQGLTRLLPEITPVTLLWVCAVEMAVQRGRRKRRLLLGLPAKHHGLECCVAQPMSEMVICGASTMSATCPLLIQSLPIWHMAAARCESLLLSHWHEVGRCPQAR
jgi:hypothetical protein